MTRASQISARRAVITRGSRFKFVIWLPKPARNGFFPQRLCMMKCACFASRRRLPCTCLGQPRKILELNHARRLIHAADAYLGCSSQRVQTAANGCNERHRNAGRLAQLQQKIGVQPSWSKNKKPAERAQRWSACRRTTGRSGGARYHHKKHRAKPWRRSRSAL